MKRLLAALISLVIICTMFAGCGAKNTDTGDTSSNASTQAAQTAQQTSSSNASGSQELTVWMQKMQNDTTNTMLTERGQEFAKQNNVKVNVEIIAYEDIMPKYTAAIESGKVPDVSFFCYQDIGQFYEKGAMADVSDIFSKIEQDRGTIYPSLKKVFTFDGKQYGVPFWAESTVMYYRKDMLAAAGFNEAPKTWDEYRKVVKATTNVSKGIYGAGIGYGKGNADAENFTRALLWSFGGAEFAEDGKTITFNSPETVSAVKFVNDLFTVDKVVPPSAVGWDNTGNNKSYISGQAATIFNVGSIASTLKKDNPDLYKNTGLAPFPAGPKGSFAPGICNCLGIFKDAPNPELSAKLIEFYIGDKEWYTSWIEQSAPLILPVFEADASNTIWSDPMNKPFIDSIKSYTYIGYKGTFTSKAGEVYNLRLFNDAFSNMITNKQKPEKMVEDLHAKIQEVFSK